MNLLLHLQTQLILSSLIKDPAGSVIFDGPDGIGKRTTALEVARQLNCLGDQSGSCAHCRQIAGKNFADLIEVSREDKNTITIEQIRALTTSTNLKSASSTNHRVIIISDAETLAAEAQNALLKFLEEPPARTLTIIVTEQFNKLLPTIRSRCQRIAFTTPGIDAVAELLRNTTNTDFSEAKAIAALAEGLPGGALTLQEDPAAVAALRQLQQSAASILDKSPFERLILAAKIFNNTDLAHFGRILHQEIATRLTKGAVSSTSAAQNLAALEVFRRQLATKVSSRVALERLMLELR